MPGIMDVYVSHAENHISKHQADHTTERISRAQVELDILRSLDKETFPIEMKVSWYHAILSTSLFDSIWRGAAVRLQLTDANTARYTPDESQQDFKLPPGMDASILESAPNPTTKSTKSRQSKVPAKRAPIEHKPPYHPPPPSSPTVSSSPSSSGSSSTTTTPTPSQIALAARLGSSTPADPVFSSRHPIPDARGLARQTGDDGGYGVPRRTVGAQSDASGIGNGSGSASGKVRKSNVKGSAKFVRGSAAASRKRKKVKTLSKAFAGMEE